MKNKNNKKTENMDHIHPKFKKLITAITLFSGAGGGTLGLLYNYVKELLAIDNWSVAQKTFEYNFKGEREIPFWLADILALSAEDILRRIYMMAGELSIMLLSPPCQGFSVASGRINPLDPRNLLFLHSLDLIAGVRPKCFIIENVPGMDDDRNIAIFNEIKLRLKEKLGLEYEVRCFRLLALNYKTPQKRQRLIFIGYQKNLGVIPVPPAPQFQHIPGLRIVDVTPEIIGVKVGQSKKTIKCNEQFMTTRTASGEVITYENGHETTLSVKQDLKFSTFPDWYEIPAGIKDKDAHKLCGNTIPPEFMRAIVEQVLNQIGDKL
jgi:DNA (cytosine-5)-methyltransferase 1